MKNQISFCKDCGAQLDGSTKVCPQCGAKNASLKQPIYKKWWFWVILAVIVFAAIGAGNSGPKKVGQNQPSGSGGISQPSASGDPAPAVRESKFYVGEQLELNSIVVSMDSVTESSGSAYNKPGDGNVFVLCSFTIENNSASEINVSSLLCFDGYCDGYACNYSLSAQLESSDQQLDGAVAAGKKMKGSIGFEVPAGWQELEIRFTPDFWAQQDIIFVANH